VLIPAVACRFALKVILELPQMTREVLERWSKRNGFELQEHLTELVREDVRTIVRSIGPSEFDALFGLDQVSVAVASELEGEALGRYAPFLEGVGVGQGRVDVRDNKAGRIAEVTFRNDLWNCDVDSSDSCVHVGFALAILKVREMMSSLQGRG